MSAIKRAAAGIRYGLLAYFFTPRTRAARLRARAARSRNWYECAGQDQDFLDELSSTNRAFDPAVSDGLEHASVR